MLYPLTLPIRKNENGATTLNVRQAIKGLIPHGQKPCKKGGGLAHIQEPSSLPSHPVLDDPRVKWGTVYHCADVNLRCYFISPRGAVEATEFRDEFITALTQILSRLNRFERVEIGWWMEPYLVIEVKDIRKTFNEYGYRLGVSFDMRNGKLASSESDNRQVYHRKGWGPLLNGLVGYETPFYKDWKPKSSSEPLRVFMGT